MARMRILLFSALLAASQTLSAQWEKPWWLEGSFSHLDVGLTVSSTGLGAELTTPVGDLVRLRAGFTVMPRFTLTSNFPVEVNSQEIWEDKKRRMQDMMENFMGYSIRDNVDMKMTPTWGSFKFLVDFMPIPGNKHWNVTLGFHAGPSRIGKAINAESGSPTLAAVNAYNSLYVKACKGEPMIVYEDNYGRMHEADLPPNFGDRLIKMRMAGMPLGYFPDGDRAMMVPDRYFRAQAEMRVNKVRPYLGLGYNTTLSADGAWRLTVDAGVLFWGGHPRVYVDNVYKVNKSSDSDMGSWDTETWEWIDATPQRIDLTRDVTNIPGKVGSMVRLAKKFDVCPHIGITLSRRIF